MDEKLNEQESIPGSKTDGNTESNCASVADEAIANAIALDALVSTEFRAKYDAAAKELLAEKAFLALIMKFCVEEYKDCELVEIEGLIEGTPEISVTPVQRDMPTKDISSPDNLSQDSPSDTTSSGEVLSSDTPSQNVSAGSTSPHNIPPRITGSDTVDKTINEGTYYFDIKFDAALPKKLVDEIEEKTKHGKNKSIRHALGVIINVEPHGRFAPGYPVNTRSEYYQARLLSSQYGTVFTGEEYEKLKHVYSVWILLNSPAYCANTVSVYDKTEKHIIGVGEDEAIKEFHSDPSTLVIRLGDVDKTENELLKVLGTILSNKKSIDDKISVLKEYDIPMTLEVERKVGNMYSLADVIAEEAAAEAAAEAAERAAEAQKKEDMLTAIRNIMEAFGVTIEKAMDALKIPQEQRSIYIGQV